MTASDFNQTVNVTDHANAFVAQKQKFYSTYYGEDFIEVSVVPESDLAPCLEERFVPPAGAWPQADEKLRNLGGLLITGQRGIGRRTAALRLLSGIRAGAPIHELVPTWKRPNTAILPALNGIRCLLDMSEPTEKPPSDDFGGKLLDWARANGLFLVVIVTDEVGVHPWPDSVRDAVVVLRSPDARELAVRELRLTADEARTEILDDPSFTSIWRSSPKAEDARRLAELVAERPYRSAEEIADEYQGWRHIADRIWLSERFTQPLAVTDRDQVLSAAWAAR